MKHRHMLEASDAVND